MGAAQTKTTEMVVKLFIQDPRGEITEIDLSDSEFQSYTVLQLKTKIREKTARDSSQKLIFKECLLKDAAKLSDYGIQHESTIHLETQPVTKQLLIIDLCGRCHIFCLDEDEFKSCPVDHLKRRIQDATGIPGQMQLIYEVKLLADSYTLSEYGIQDESTIHLETQPVKKQLLIIDLCGRCHIFCLDEDEFKSCPVDHLKRRIQDATGIPGQMQLIYEVKLLADGYTLSEYGIQDLEPIDFMQILQGGELGPEEESGGMGDKGGKNRSMETVFNF